MRSGTGEASLVYSTPPLVGPVQCDEKSSGEPEGALGGAAGIMAVYEREPSKALTRRGVIRDVDGYDVSALHTDNQHGTGRSTRYHWIMGHDLQDRISMEIARRVVAELTRRPELIRVARENLARWSERNADVPSLIRCYDEWRAILDRPLPEVCSELLQPGGRGQRLRQNSPFVGILSPKEVWAIKEQMRNESSAA